MSFILVVGNATFDTLSVVDHYPQEDEELRAVQQWVDCGGNAINTLKVLINNRHRCDFVGVVAQDHLAPMLIQRLQQQGIGLQYLQTAQGQTPQSHILLNQQTGSRTIVHYRDLPELAAETLQAIPVEHYDWLHFEGRNVEQLAPMLRYARDTLIDQPISLELEKVREGLEALVSLADIALFSRDYAQTCGFHDAESFLRQQQQQHGAMWMTCTWGAEGAWAIDQLGEVFHAPAPQITVVDSNGAGDAFNAGLIHALVTGRTLAEALRYAVDVASRKVQQYGFAELF